MNRCELQNYEVLYQGIEEGIIKTREDIQKSKEELVEARKIRRNRMEYDALAKVWFWRLVEVLLGIRTQN